MSILTLESPKAQAEKICATEKVNGTRLIKVSFEKGSAGLKIYMQSPLDWRMLAKTSKWELGGVVCYIPRQEKIEGVNSRFLGNYNNYENNGMPNFAMLLAENINAGVTFVFPPEPVSDSKLTEWIDIFKEDIRILYLTYCKPKNITVEITCATIDKEYHN